MKKTVVIGASPNPDRYSYLATRKLSALGYEVIPMGIRKGEISGINIVNDKPDLSDVDTITLYINPKNQESWYDYIIQLHPKRIIFNPGTENPVLEKLASEYGIETTEACTLVLLSTKQY